MRYKMTKKYQIRHQICFFFKLKMHQIPLSVGTRWGAYDAPQGPLVAWGRPPPHFPLDAFGVSISSRRYGTSVLRPPQHKILATPVFSLGQTDGGDGHRYQDSPTYCIQLDGKLANCTKLGRLFLSKIIKIVATSCQMSRLKCTKFDFGWGSAPDPAGGAYMQRSQTT